MRTVLVALTLLSTVSSTYVYLSLPDGIQEPWKLMLLDATYRTVSYFVMEFVCF
uniref:Uncharacterized protein n=1 Tax=Neogobius melanostomus TaxID=47308 RepID=A0A8C6UXV3_9GOBI